MWTAVGLSLCVSVEARAGSSITVGPSLLEFRLRPGTSAAQNIYVRSHSSKRAAFSTEVFDYRLGDGGRFRVVSPASVPDSVAPWITVTPARFEVEPGGFGIFKVVVSAPPDAAGGRYAKVMVRGVPVKQVDGTSLTFGLEVGITTLISTGEETPQLQASILAVDPPSASSLLTVTLKLQNTGPVHVNTAPSVEIVGPVEDFVGHMAHDPRYVILLPGETRTLILHWGGELTPAAYEAIATVYYADQVVVAERRFEISASPGGAGVMPVFEVQTLAPDTPPPSAGP
jgi:hypothetical protein